MLKNAYFLAKIGADTAENERNFAKNLQLPYGSPRGSGGLRSTRYARSGHRASDQPPGLVGQAPNPAAFPKQNGALCFRSFCSIMLSRMENCCPCLESNGSASFFLETQARYLFTRSKMSISESHAEVRATYTLHSKNERIY